MTISTWTSEWEWVIVFDVISKQLWAKQKLFMCDTFEVVIKARKMGNDSGDSWTWGH